MVCVLTITSQCVLSFVCNVHLNFGFRLNVPSIGHKKRRKMLSLKTPISGLPLCQKTLNPTTQSVSWSWKISL